MSQNLQELARQAVRGAVKNLAGSGRAFVHNVGLEAEKIVKRDGQGMVSTQDASQLIKEAIGRMVQDGELEAPIEPWRDWKLLK